MVATRLTVRVLKTKRTLRKSPCIYRRESQVTAIELDVQHPVKILIDICSKIAILAEQHRRHGVSDSPRRSWLVRAENSEDA